MPPSCSTGTDADQDDRRERRLARQPHADAPRLSLVGHPEMLLLRMGCPSTTTATTTGRRPASEVSHVRPA
ncbi:hypothetical protein GCU56_10790 [Geodermatophilus sabuli]|uniref:Uncharacterized protein n=1 Tax=Geodermatophilus sabuli TaxID=1564158 RepID=A0A7K3W365_9ACTN|nr:hypothetical protein [Geodermatophilus sabuli]NEK58357.1 hypothetical protein [Geodermatophilus sabuli]